MIAFLIPPYTILISEGTLNLIPVNPHPAQIVPCFPSEPLLWSLSTYWTPPTFSASDDSWSGYIYSNSINKFGCFWVIPENLLGLSWLLSGLAWMLWEAHKLLVVLVVTCLVTAPMWPNKDRLVLLAEGELRKAWISPALRKGAGSRLSCFTPRAAHSWP